jgi:hypothetical protein
VSPRAQQHREFRRPMARRQSRAGASLRRPCTILSAAAVWLNHF